MTLLKLAPWELALLANELKSRTQAATFVPGSVLTPSQARFRADPCRFRIGLCGRGAGKTVGIGFILSEVARKHGYANCAYVTGTRRMAKYIVWPILCALNDKYRLGFTPNHSDLVMVHENGGRIQLMGANNVLEIDKLRGQPWDLVCIDEAQMLGRTLRQLCTEIVPPRLVDRNGHLLLTGTPGPVLGGPFYEYWKLGKKGKGWTVHEWTMADNPHILNGRRFEDIVAEEAERRNVSVEDPSIQREFFGRWVRDVDALVLHVRDRNYFEDAPDMDQFVIGVDIGYDDADAIAVVGWPTVAETPRAYLVEEHVNRGANVTDLGERVSELNDRYNPIAIAVDTAGIGKKVFAELASDTWNLPVVPFAKGDKTARVLKLRAAIDRAEFKCQRGGYFDQDAALLQWELDPEKGIRRLSEKSPDDKAFHSDIIDAVIGGFMEAQSHWNVVPEKPRTPEQQMREERREARAKRQAGKDQGLFGDSRPLGGSSTIADLFSGGGSGSL